MPDGAWIVARAPQEIPVNQLASGRYRYMRAKTLPAVADKLREAHTRRWSEAS